MTTKWPLLIVEDDELIREGLQEYLSEDGFEVLTAENGLRGLECIRQLDGKCLVLLDLEMPVMNGEQLVNQLSQEDSTAVRNVPVIVLSARSKEFKNSRIKSFIRKPLDMDLLMEQISKNL